MKAGYQLSVDDELLTIICMHITAPLLLPDNHVGRCLECDSEIQFRPNVPPSHKLCVRCAVPRLLLGARFRWMGAVSPYH
jgi:hypothetical protein